ncbi:MAG: tRNA (guanosine(37)-N1)-methyltransferase TrmD, partial [Eggerthellaceae bacterium]|nr:tRNA (guanosine(37)-N1)-methyltransferase TrmD [Eggerthellaceae bacterium]
MKIDVLTIFPEMYDSVMDASMMRIARSRGLLDFRAHNLRDWTSDPHRTTDDSAYGGGAGQVMMVEPIFEALQNLNAQGAAKVIFMAPTCKVFNDFHATRLSAEEQLIFVCGHYEGIDQRAFELADEVFSIGEYVLTGGELASMVMIDAIVRQIDGVLGNQESIQTESFA